MIQEVLEVQHGIWIDEQWIRDAGLGRRLRVIVQPGEIRIVPTLPETETPSLSQGWDVFRSLGNDAQPGQLDNAAEDHDRYLYGKDEYGRYSALTSR
jgi:hypothetical protein